MREGRSRSRRRVQLDNGDVLHRTECFGDRLKAECAKQLGDSRLGRSQSAIVTQPRPQRRAQPGLFWIELPWMDIERSGRTATLTLSEPGVHETRWQKSEITATGGGEVQRSNPQRCRRKLRKITRRKLQPM